MKIATNATSSNATLHVKGETVELLFIYDDFKKTGEVFEGETTSASAPLFVASEIPKTVTPAGGLLETIGQWILNREEKL